jgi:ribosomal protein L32
MTAKIQACKNCGSTDLMLCEDFTRYTPLRRDGEAWDERHAEAHEESIERDYHDSAMNSPRRVMCEECGEYYRVEEVL